MLAGGHVEQRTGWGSGFARPRRVHNALLIWLPVYGAHTPYADEGELEEEEEEDGMSGLTPEQKAQLQVQQMMRMMGMGQ